MPDRPSPSTRRRKRRLPLWAEMILWAGAAYVVLAAVNLAAPPDGLCITDSWCIAPERWWLIAAVQTSGLVALVAAFRLAVAWAVAMLGSRRRHWWLLLFFAALGGIGIGTWLTTVSRAEWFASIHVPLVGALFIGIGVVMFAGFRRRRPDSRRPGLRPRPPSERPPKDRIAP